LMTDLLTAGLFGDLSSAAVNTILDRYISAWANVDADDFQRHEQALSLKVLGLQMTAGPRRVELSSVRKDLERRFEALPISALLATSFAAATAVSADYDRLVAWTVTASIVLLARDTKHQSKVDDACATVRLICQKDERFVLSSLAEKCATAKSIFDAAVVSELSAPRKSVRRRYEKIRVLLDAYLDRKHAITRSRDGEAVDEITHVTISAPVATIDHDDEIDGTAEAARTVAYLQSGADCLNPEHQPHRIEFDIPAVGAGAALTSRPHQDIRRATLAHSILRRRLALPCQYGAFTDHEMRLVGKAFDSFVDGATGRYWRANVLIVASLVTGRTPAELQTLTRSKTGRPKGAKQWFEISEDIALCYDASLERNPMSALATALLYTDRPKPLRLALPLQVSVGLSRLWSERLKDKIADAEIETAFNELWPPHHRPQTLRRMASVIRDRVVRAGHDSSIAAYISGDSAQNVPALYYVTHDNEHVERVYRETVDSLPGGPFEWPEVSRHNVGSQLHVQERMIRSFYKAADAELKSLSRSSPRDAVFFHNRYATLVCVSLMLLTGHRPVHQPFEVLSDFDLEAGFLYLSDKELRPGNAGRFVPLPQIVVDQVNAWIDHVGQLPRYLGSIDARLIDNCRAVVGGKASLFFHLRSVSGDDVPDIVEITPKILEADLASNIWPLPLNWGRHVQRRLLMTLSSELVDAFMGHADPGAEAYATHSGLSWHDMDDLRTAIADVAKNLRVRVFRGLE
jgi:hypothetical protein